MTPLYTICEYRSRYGWPLPTRWYILSEDGAILCWCDSLFWAARVVAYLLAGTPEWPAESAP